MSDKVRDLLDKQGRVKVDELLSVRAMIKEMHAIPLDGLRFLFKGKEYQLNPRGVETFSLIGLNNTHIIEEAFADPSDLKWVMHTGSCTKDCA